MEEEEIEPASRDDVLFDIRYGLRRAFRFRPRKKDYREADFHSWAEAVMRHLELSGLRFFRKTPERGHTAPEDSEGSDGG